MQKLLNLLNSKESFENFGKNYGKVKDKSLAIYLLCKTPYAWYVLDESLQKDSEIIMYYQPLGRIECYYYTNKKYNPYDIEEDQGVNEIDEEECYISAGEIKNVAQKGFKTINSKSKQQIPEINLPEGFNLNLYLAIQEQLDKNTLAIDTKERGENYDDFDEYNIKGINSADIEGELSTIIRATFDRSRLASIVPEVTKSFEQNAKQKQMQ